MKRLLILVLLALVSSAISHPPAQAMDEAPTACATSFTAAADLIARLREVEAALVGRLAGNADAQKQIPLPGAWTRYWTTTSSVANKILEFNESSLYVGSYSQVLLMEFRNTVAQSEKLGLSAQEKQTIEEIIRRHESQSAIYSSALIQAYGDFLFGTGEIPWEKLNPYEISGRINKVAGSIDLTSFLNTAHDSYLAHEQILNAARARLGQPPRPLTENSDLELWLRLRSSQALTHQASSTLSEEFQYSIPYSIQIFYRTDDQEQLTTHYTPSYRELLFNRLEAVSEGKAPPGIISSTDNHPRITYVPERLSLLMTTEMMSRTEAYLESRLTDLANRYQNALSRHATAIQGGQVQAHLNDLHDIAERSLDLENAVQGYIHDFHSNPIYFWNRENPSRFQSRTLAMLSMATGLENNASQLAELARRRQTQTTPAIESSSYPQEMKRLGFRAFLNWTSKTLIVAGTAFGVWELYHLFQITLR